jgi:phosphoglycolate phosphatase
VTYIFDLDGTLIDSSERLYRLFQFLVPQSTFTKQEYWNLKRDKVKHEMIFERYFPGMSFQSFNEKWMEIIETRKYLDMDKNYEDTLDVLDALKNKGEKLYLLTARQSKSELFHELGRLEIKDYFDEIFVTENKVEKDFFLKYQKWSKDTLFISDMGKDILVGKKYGLQTVGITHGFMNEEKLKEYKPGRIIEELNHLC